MYSGDISFGYRVYYYIHGLVHFTLKSHDFADATIVVVITHIELKRNIEVLFYRLEKQGLANVSDKVCFLYNVIN